MIQKLLIAIPSYDTMRAEFVQSLTALMQRLNREGQAYEVKILTGTLVHVARDHLARHAINNGFSHVLWIDSDMVFQDSIVDDLAMSGKDMVCGSFISRHSPFLNVVFSRLEPNAERITDMPDDLFRIAGCGFGCVFMKTQVLGDVMNGNGGRCFLPTQKLGEDLAFCQRAVGCGYEIWCEPTARLGHIGAVPIWPEDAERMRGEIQELNGKKLE